MRNYLKTSTFKENEVPPEKEVSPLFLNIKLLLNFNLFLNIKTFSHYSQLFLKSTTLMTFIYNKQTRK